VKLSDLKPCACCGGPLIKPPIVTWHVIRVSTALLHPRHARETLGLAQMTGSLAIAEVMGPAADAAVAIVGEQPGASWTELHVCFDCYCTKVGDLAGMCERADEPPSAVEARRGFTVGELLLGLALLALAALAVASIFAGGGSH
jgi:hypothetical protein